MSKKHITIDVDVDAYSFDGGDGFTADDIANYEHELSIALDNCLPDADYKAHVYITIKPHVIRPVVIVCISGLDLKEPDQLAVHDLVRTCLSDSKFTDSALEKAWN